jgi:DNA end-binding protein Ku
VKEFDMRSGIWKGSLSFGLLNIPVTLQTAAEDNDLHFSMLDGKNLAPIKYHKVNAETGKEVPYDRIVKGYEYKKGEFVIMDDKDFKAANIKATQTIDIEDFVLLSEIDTMLFEKPYYLVPQKDGAKGYALLHQALLKTEKVAVAKVVIRTKQHLCAVLAKGDYLILEILRFAHEIKDVNEVDYLKEAKATKTKLNPRELKMAEDLIKGMTAKWKPDKYKDTYYADLMKRIQLKVKAGKGHVIEEPEEDTELLKPTKVDDLMPLLKQSLAARSKTRRTSAKTSRTSRSLH